MCAHGFSTAEVVADSHHQQEKLDPGRNPHVGIIGAGLSGLRCADLLLQYGFDVTILEARNRVGGRMHQEQLPNGHLIDVGPNWIHGTNDNPILDLAKQTKTVVGSWDTTPYVYDEEGALFPVKDGERYSEIMWSIILEAFRYSEKHCAEISPDKSLYDFFQQRILEAIPETEHDYGRRREIVMHMSELWGAFVGSPITGQSLKFFWLEECIEGGAYSHSTTNIWEFGLTGRRKSFLCRHLPESSPGSRKARASECDREVRDKSD